jgi:hypothetical protein
MNECCKFPEPRFRRCPWLTVRHAISLLCLPLFVPASSFASSLDILPTAASDDGWGARVTLLGCSGGGDLNLSGTISSNQQVCNTITATNATISGDVTFTAGSRIALGAGFAVPSGSASRPPSIPLRPVVMRSSRTTIPATRPPTAPATTWTSPT